MNIGVIDIGTNSVRMLVLKQAPKPVIVKSYLITTRLGQGMAQSSALSEEAINRTIIALKEFRQHAMDNGVERIFPIATSAVREAANRRVFLERVKGEVGWDVEVISGEMEASLGFEGVVRGLPLLPDNPLVIDIGGGSTELIWENNNKVNYSSSPVGAVRMTEQKSSQEEIADIFKPVLTRIGKGKHEIAVGIGGTITTLAAIDLKLEDYVPELVHGYEMTIQRIKEINRFLKEMELKERQGIKGLQPERADIITAGIDILEVVMTKLSIAKFIASETDIMLGRALRFFEKEK